MKLSQLAAAAGLVCQRDAEITSMTCHSREVGPGALFAALEGTRADGKDFIPRAAAQGAAAILCRGGAETGLPVLSAAQPRQALGAMAAEFYGHPAEEMTMIAVTGTKGKTTTAHMLREILTAGGEKTGMIGTLGAFSGQCKISDTVNTTPEPILLHRLLRQLRADGCTGVVMEVSSQAMKQERLAGVHFDVGIFLNLSPDHIGPGEHESLAEYRRCKAELFRRCGAAVGNGADPSWPFVAECVPEGVPVHTFGPCKTRPGPNLTTLLEAEGRAEYAIPMPGAFNGENAMAAITAAELLGVPEEAIRRGLATVTVPGRCMVYPTGRGYDVLIDYAHNGASFRALFAALRQRGPARIIAVFGAGGDRPPLRRRDLARAAAEGADLAVITTDNPRRERAEDICAEIAEALAPMPHVILPDRREAIRFALDSAEEGDIVALLGKGHEQYIEESGVRRHFSEREVLDEYFGR